MLTSLHVIFKIWFVYFNWRLIILQYCGGFCHTWTWISHECCMWFFKTVWVKLTYSNCLLGWRGRWEGGSGWGTHVNPWLFHFNVWQNSLQIKKKLTSWTPALFSMFFWWPLLEHLREGFFTYSPLVLWTLSAHEQWWRRKWQPTPVFLPGESHGQRTLARYGPWGLEESDTTEQLTLHKQWF